MAVVDGQWRSVWLPELSLWFGTVLLFAVAVGIYVFFWHRDREEAPPVEVVVQAEEGVKGICLYLHDDAITKLYLMSSYGAVLREEVQNTRTQSLGVNAKGAVAGVGAGGEVTVSEAEVRTYIKAREPITFIQELVQVLEGGDAVVYADLTTGLITPNAAVTKMAGEDETVQEVRLSALADFVWIKGKFRRGTDAAAGHFTASYGDGAHVRFLCAADGLPDKFTGRCLVKVDGWDNGDLDVTPYAIFR